MAYRTTKTNNMDSSISFHSNYQIKNYHSIIALIICFVLFIKIFFYTFKAKHRTFITTFCFLGARFIRLKFHLQHLLLLMLQTSFKFLTSPFLCHSPPSLFISNKRTNNRNERTILTFHNNSMG